MFDQMARHIAEGSDNLTDLSGLTWGEAIETEQQKATKAMEALDKTLSDLNATLKDIAAALRGELPAAAQAGAQGIENAINGIDPNPIEVEVRYNDDGYQPREGGGAQTYGERGGLVTAAGIQY